MKSIHPKIQHFRINKGVRFFFSEGGLPAVVYLTGSVDLGSEVSAKHRTLVGLASMLFDEGTKKRSKKDIQEFLDDRGAKISFSHEGRHLIFGVQCLKKHFGEVVGLLSEMLNEPLFPSSQFETTKKRLATMLLQEKEDTRNLASVAISKMIYSKEHPNALSHPDELQVALKKTTRKDLVSFWEGVRTTGELLLVAVGDLNANVGKSAISKAFSSWQGLPVKPYTLKAEASTREDYKEIHVPHKTSVDIFLGARLGIAKSHADYYPLTVLMAVLGSDFSARLFQEVREKRGLTYGIYSYLAGLSDRLDGHWFVWATFAPNLLEKGEEAIAEVLKDVVEKGLTPKEVRDAKQKLTGRYLIDLAVPTRFAAVLLTTLHDGYELSQISNWKEKIGKVTKGGVDRVIKKYIHPDRLAVAAAGTFPALKK